MLNEGTCCLCMSEEETNFNIFTVMRSIPLSNMIEFCIGVDIKTKLQSRITSSTNQAPVCNECVLNLSNFHSFKQKVLKAQSWMEDVSQTDNQSNEQLEIVDEQAEFQIIENGSDDASLVQIIVLHDESDQTSDQQLVHFQESEQIPEEIEQTVNHVSHNYVDPVQGSDHIRILSKSPQKLSTSQVTTKSLPQKRAATEDDGPDVTKKGKTLKDAMKKVALQVNECIICPAVLDDILELTNHISTHDNLRCKVCHRGFQRFSNLKRHFLMSHSKPKPFVCDLCGLGFSFSVNLQAHADLHYSGKIKAKNKS